MPANSLLNGTIEEITRNQENTLLTVRYVTGRGNQRREEQIRLAVGPRTIILNANGFPVSANFLRRGMRINATFSSAMTRSIPPQANAYLIRILGREPQEHVTTGSIINVDQKGRSFTLLTEQVNSSVIRFNVTEDTKITDQSGRLISFFRLRSGMRVRVRHANFMTTSIPPQTTAFAIRVL